MTWAKSLVKRLLRPLFRPVIVRLHYQQEQIDQLAQQLPLLLNAIATQNATAREFERYRRKLEARLEDAEAQVARLTELVAALEVEELSTERSSPAQSRERPRSV